MNVAVTLISHFISVVYVVATSINHFNAKRYRQTLFYWKKNLYSWQIFQYVPKYCCRDILCSCFKTNSCKAISVANANNKTVISRARAGGQVVPTVLGAAGAASIVNLLSQPCLQEGISLGPLVSAPPRLRNILSPACSSESYSVSLGSSCPCSSGLLLGI